MPDERFKKATVDPSVAAERGDRLIHVAVKRSSVPIIERVCDCDFGFDPFKPEAFQRQQVEERRAGAERMNRRADIVDEARPRQLRRAHPAADCVVRFQHKHRKPGARTRDRRRQPVRPGADYHDIVLSAHPS